MEKIILAVEDKTFIPAYLSISFKNLAPSQSFISLYVLSAFDFKSCNTLIPWALISSNLFLAAVSVDEVWINKIKFCKKNDFEFKYMFENCFGLLADKLLHTLFLDSKIELLSHPFSHFLLLFILFTQLFWLSYRKIGKFVKSIHILQIIHKCMQGTKSTFTEKNHLSNDFWIILTRSGCWCCIILFLLWGGAPTLALFSPFLVSSCRFLCSCCLLSFSFFFSLSLCFFFCLSCSKLILQLKIKLDCHFIIQISLKYTSFQIQKWSKNLQW